MSKRSSAVPAIFLLVNLLTTGALFAQRPIVRLGLIFDGPAETNALTAETYEREITELLQEEFDVQFPDAKTLTADWTATGVRAMVDQLLGDPEVDQVVAVGFIASNDLGRRGPLPKPCYAALVIDPDVQGVPHQTKERRVSADTTEQIGVSGVENLNYVTLGLDIEKELQTFRSVSPYERLALLYAAALKEIVPDIEDRIRGTVTGVGVAQVDPVAVRESLDEALASIPAEVDAVYVSTLPQAGSDAQIEKLAAGLIARKLPSFSQTGRPEVEHGLLMSLSRTQTFLRRARRLALNMQQVLAGEPAAEQPVDFRRREALVINMATARAVGVSPSFLIMTEAELLHEERADIQRTLSLSAVVRESENTNLDLAVADRQVAIGRQAVRETRSSLLPQLGVTGGGVFIDKDRASFGAGQSPQRQAFGELSASQVLYSNNFQTAYQVEKNNQKVREELRNSVRLDVIEEASTSYLDVLRAKTVESIQKDNLALTRSNLELAQVRVEIGQAGREEVFRWESQISNNRRDVIETNANRNAAEIQLNRVLNRPIEEPFLTTEAGLDDPELVTSFEMLRPYVESPATFDVYRNFMTAEAFAQSPEISELQHLVRSTQRSLKGSKRAYYIPSISASASGSYMGRYGAGSQQPDPPLQSLWTNPYNWQVAVTGTYNIFNGGFREARLQRDREAVQNLELQLQATRLRVEQRVRSALHRAGASFAGIDLAQDAASAAGRNLDLVSDSYAEGVIDILRLLDAQNWALSADLVAANAIYNHLVDLMAVQRAVGRFDYFRSAQDRQEFINRLEEYFQISGQKVRQP